MPKPIDRNPASASGDWYIDTHCIDCAASREVAPGLIVHRGGKSVFARQPANEEEERAAWRAVLVCPTASVGTESHRIAPEGLFPQERAPGVYRCGYNARSSFGAHAYFVRRGEGNALVDSPRYASKLVRALERLGGIADVLLTHKDDVADADRYARHFGARVWIHEEDRSAAPYATNLLSGRDAIDVRNGLVAIPVPGHTRGSVVYLIEETYLFTGDSLAWGPRRHDLIAFRDACWYSWEELKRSLARLEGYRFEWILAGTATACDFPRRRCARDCARSWAGCENANGTPPTAAMHAPVSNSIFAPSDYGFRRRCLGRGRALDGYSRTALRRYRVPTTLGA